MSINKLDNEWTAFLKARALPKTDGIIEVSSPEPLKKYIDPVRLQTRLDRVQDMVFAKEEKEFLKLQGKFPNTFLTYISKQWPRAKVLVKGDELKVRVEGQLPYLALWEVPISIQIHDLWYMGIYNADTMDPNFVIGEGARRLQVKLDFLRNSGTRFVEAGVRMRYGWDWYSLVLQSLLGDARDLVLGTTNPTMAFAFSIPLLSYDDLLTGATPGVRVSATSVEELGRLAEEHSDSALVIQGVNAFEMAHLHSHFGDRLVFEWGTDLVSDVGPAGRSLPLVFDRAN